MFMDIKSQTAAAGKPSELLAWEGVALLRYDKWHQSHPHSHFSCKFILYRWILAWPETAFLAVTISPLRGGNVWSFLSVCIKIKGTTVHYQRTRLNNFFPSLGRGVIPFSTQPPKLNSSSGTRLPSFNWGASKTFGFRQSCRPYWIGFHVSVNQPWVCVSINSPTALLRVLKKSLPTLSDSVPTLNCPTGKGPWQSCTYS